MMAEAEAWTPNMALLLLGSCCVFVSYAVTMAAERDVAKSLAVLLSVLSVTVKNVWNTGG